MVHHKTGQGGVIGRHPPGNHPKGGIGPTGRLHPTRRPDPGGVHVKQQPQHHLRVIRRPARPVPAVAGVKARQIHPLHHLHHKPGQMPLLQPIPHTHRQQKQLIAITTHIAKRHEQLSLMAPSHPRISTFCDSLYYA